MAITPEVLQNLAKMVDLRIEALTNPTSGGQPQAFQIRPSNLLLSTVGPLIPTETVLAAAIPVTIEVTWGIETEGGETVDSQHAVIHSPSHDSTLVAPHKGLMATVMILPDFVELRRDQVLTTKTRYVTAVVRMLVTVDTVVGQPPRVIAETSMPLIRHPITVPAVPVPTMAIFIRNKDLGINQGGKKFAVVAVPSDSAIAGVSALRDACETLRRLSEAASTLVGLAGPAGVGGLPALTGLGAGLGKILDVLNAHMPAKEIGIAFCSGDALGNLNDITLISQPWYRSLNDIEAEDEISSLILVGPPGRRIKLYKHRKLRGFGVTVESSPRCVTIVNNLNHKPPISDPPNFAAQSDLDESIDDAISSFAFL